MEGERCLRGGDGRLGFIEEDRAKIWKKHMEKIMNQENKWDHMMETDLVEGSVEKVARNEIVEAIQRMKTGKAVEKVARNEIVEAIQRMKTGKATGPSEVSVEMIVGSGEIGVNPFRPVLLSRRKLLKLFYFTELLTTQKHLKKKKIIFLHPQT